MKLCTSVLNPSWVFYNGSRCDVSKDSYEIIECSIWQLKISHCIHSIRESWVIVAYGNIYPLNLYERDRAITRTIKIPVACSKGHNMPFVRFGFRDELNASAHAIAEGSGELQPLGVVHGAEIGAILNDFRNLLSLGAIHFLPNSCISSAPDDIAGRHPVNLRKNRLASHWGRAGWGIVSDPFAFWNVKRFGCAVLTERTGSLVV